MSLTVNDKRVLKLIKVGSENSITGAEISLITKLSERTVQDIISRLITRYSIPIVGVRNGAFRRYFIPANQEELLDGAKAFYNQVQEEQKRLTVLLNADLKSYKPLLKGDNEYV
jgi:phage protein